ncbi:MAG: hypothetical protein ABSA18_10020 [Dehalococcoidia bacterium]|jgi:hypothetical protein
MVITPFSDNIVNPSELRKNQAHWLGMAAASPITVTYGDFKLAILNREKIANLYKENYYLELGMKLCISIRVAGAGEPLPWMQYLNAEEKIEFINELVEGISESTATNNWYTVDTILGDWKATAETLGNPEAMRALTAKRPPKSEYIPLR